MSTFIPDQDDPLNQTPVKSRKLEETDAAADCVVAIPWGDVLEELLSMIADRLGLIDLLSYRAVCKSWRAASITSSAEIESHSEPSFLVHDEKDDKFDFYYRSREMKMYTMTIPELEKSICLASNYGWLLMFKQDSMFFFCPFTRAKIELPSFPNADNISEHFAAFSAPPTSPECVLLVVKPSNDNKMEMHVLRRGASNWMKEKDYTSARPISKIIGVFYDKEEESFSFMDDKDTLLDFSLKEENWETYRIIHHKDITPKTAFLRFHLKKEYFSYIKPWSTNGRLKDQTPIDICGTTFPDTRMSTVVYNQSISMTTGVQHLKGIWFHPRTFYISPHFRF